MRRRLLYSLAFLLFASLFVGAPASAQGQLDAGEQEVVDAFIDQLGQVLDVSGNEALEIIGEPGDDDLFPGASVFLGDEATRGSGELPEGGASLTGPCQGIAASVAPAEDGGFEVIDIAADFDDEGPPIDLDRPLDEDGVYAAAFTASNPFTVHVNGFVVYAGQADPAPINHTWVINTLGISIDSGGDDNPDGKNRNAGTVDLQKDLPGGAKVNALFKISGSMDADEGFHCSGQGYFKTIGGSRTLEIAGYVLVLAAGLGALFNTRPARTWKA